MDLFAEYVKELTDLYTRCDDKEKGQLTKDLAQFLDSLDLEYPCDDKELTHE